MKNWVVTLAACVALMACGSAVKLSDVPVEDKSGMAALTSKSLDAGPAGGDARGQTTVKPVDLVGAGTAAAGPSGQRVIYFDFDSFAVKPEFQGLIEVQAKFVRADKARKMAIEGHTDEKGGREYNLALGQKRAEAVRQAFVLLGVSDAQIEAVSFGKEKPAVEGADETALAKNRRAEIVYK
jgi:peptidoglycan-associated lipoprotein